MAQNSVGTKRENYPSCRYINSKKEDSNIGIGKMDAHYS